MRPIKFRAYHFPTKEMFQPSMEFVKVREVAYGVWYPRYGEKHGDVSEPMQFTGLLDKNGKEIYEGDILMFPDTESEYVDVEIGDVKVAETEVNSFFPIEYKNGEFGMLINDSELVYDKNRWLSLNTFFTDYISEKECEVIGNIYENPELLK